MNRRIFGPYVLALDPYTETGEGGSGGGGGDATAKAEEAIRRAHMERDKAIGQLDALRTEIDTIKKAGLTDAEKKEYDDLKKKQTAAEEDRKRREGEYDSLKAELIASHKTDLEKVKTDAEKERQARLTLEAEYAGEKIQNAFASTPDYFGGATAKTVLSPLTAFRALREYCAWEPVEIGGVKRSQIVVRKPDGTRILGEDGNPPPFAEAIGKLIALLPDKDQILRGSQKAGSGSSGGSNDGPGDIDLDHLTDAQLRDPKVRRALRDRSANAGGIQMGRAFTGDGLAKK